MAKDFFLQRKKAILSKLDKSSKGDWDAKIVNLCEKINQKENYYTTSSCAGRILVLIDQDKKEDNLFLRVWHEILSFEEFMFSLKRVINLVGTGKDREINLKFKQESCILHVACRTEKDAFDLLLLARNAGWKRSGIMSKSSNGYLLELVSTEKIEFPLVKNGKVLVDEGFLKVVIEKANENLRKTWGKIAGLEELIFSATMPKAKNQSKKIGVSSAKHHS